MTENFYRRLESYYQRIGKMLHLQADISAIYPNSSDKGIYRETIYSEFLKNHLPSSCNIVLGGFLFDLEGNESKQMDIIVTCSTCLRYNLPLNHTIKEFTCVEGSLAIASVKSQLTKEELVIALDNIASIPLTRPLDGRVTPLINIKNYLDWPYKIIYAHDGTKIETVLNSLN